MLSSKSETSPTLPRVHYPDKRGGAVSRCASVAIALHRVFLVLHSFAPALGTSLVPKATRQPCLTKSGVRACAGSWGSSS